MSRSSRKLFVFCSALLAGNVAALLMATSFTANSRTLRTWGTGTTRLSLSPSSSSDGNNSSHVPSTGIGKRERRTLKRRRNSTKRDQKEMLKIIQQPMDTTVDVATTSYDLDDDISDLLHCIVRAADGRKAQDIVALAVQPVTTLTSVIVFLSGNSRPQNQAIVATILEDVEEAFGIQPSGSGVPEGTAESGWMVLDYSSVMVHIMTPKSRLFYNVEGQWRDKGGKSIDISSILIPNSVVQQQSPTVPAVDEEDPFWS